MIVLKAVLLLFKWPQGEFIFVPEDGGLEVVLNKACILASLF